MSTGGDSAQGAISLPSGGGALHGVGEKFSADPFTGVATLSLPISVPPGETGCSRKSR
jgi:hypothetical protein